MPPHERWDALEEDEADCLSLSDFPVLVDDADEPKSSSAAEDDGFEFPGGGLLSPSEESHMCAADEVFFRGRILPLRRPCSPLDGSRSGSRSDSWDRYSSRSNSSGSSSSCCVSRSHSSSSARSSGSFFEQQRYRPAPPPRPPIYNNFYTHPSPKPQVLSARRTAGSGGGRRKSTDIPVGWGIFRLGVAEAPEIELSAGRSSRSAAAERAKKDAARDGGSKCHPPTVRGGGAAKSQRKAAAVSGGRFSCKCSADAVEPNAVEKRTINSRR